MAPAAESDAIALAATSVTVMAPEASTLAKAVAVAIVVAPVGRIVMIVPLKLIFIC